MNLVEVGLGNLPRGVALHIDLERFGRSLGARRVMGSCMGARVV